MQVNLYVYDGDRLKPIRTECVLDVIPRIGETVSLGTRQSQAKVQDVEYLLPSGRDEEILVGVILDREPGS